MWVCLLQKSMLASWQMNIKYTNLHIKLGTENDEDQPANIHDIF